MFEQDTNVPFTIDPKDIVQDVPQGQVESEPKAKPDYGTLKTKFNDVEKPLSDYTPEEVIANFQKGMNYDHIKSELDILKGYGLTKAEAEELKALAGDKPIREYVQSIKQNELTNKINARASELKAEGLSDAHALRMAELELKEVKPTKSQEELDLEKGFTDLAKSFPETQNFKDLLDYPKEFVDAIHSGVSPVVAYAKHLVEESKRKLEIEQQNLVNKAKNEGSASTQEPDEEDDIILKTLRKGR